MSSKSKHSKNEEQLKRRLKKRQASVSRMKTRIPEFQFDDQFGQPEFVELVKKILGSVDANTLPKFKREFYDVFATEGFGFAASLATRNVKGETERNITFESMVNDFGGYVYQSMSQQEKDQFFPYNDFVFCPEDTRLRVVFSSLKHDMRRNKRLLYSHRKPTVEIDGKSYIVAFSNRDQHLIQRLRQRIITEWDTYVGLGSAFTFLSDCVYFEPTHIRPGKSPLNAALDQPALSIWAYCQTHSSSPDILLPGSWMWERLAMSTDSRREFLTKPCYYRVGYCPIQIVDEFAVITTLLLPGFTATKEYSDIQQSGLDSATKSRFKAVAQKDGFDFLDKDQMDFQAWVHKYSVPQIMATDEVVIADQEVGPAIENPKMKPLAETLLKILEAD